MKKLNYIVLIMLVVFSFSSNGQSKTKKSKAKASVGMTFNQKDYALFGEKFQMNNVLSNKQMLAKYGTLKKGDSILVKFSSTIKEVCKKKGCWMQMDLTNGKQSFVRFKDYGFFVPLNADNSEAVVCGYAFLDIVSVDELKHYAKDGGKSQEEINKITKPEITYAFTATGVYIKK